MHANFIKMKKIILLLIFSALYVFFYSAAAQTKGYSLPEILDLINKDSLKRTVQDMQNFESRLCTKTVGHNRKVAQYLVGRLKNYGIENARIDSFFVDFTKYEWLVGKVNQNMYNVLGTLKGTGATDSTVIIGAHLDAISYIKVASEYVLTPTAPGADDNATGCAVMIEMARIMHKYNIKPHHNIDFMAYDAEEIGLKGAYYDAEKRKNAGENIIVMLNNDMVGHQPKEEKPWEVFLHWYDNALDVTEKARQALINYTTVTPFVPDASQNDLAQASDSWAYYQYGFKATFAIEKHFSPYYHSANDLTEYLNFEYCRQIARMNFVLLADYAAIDYSLGIKQDNIKLDNLIEVFPNPANDVIRVHNYNDIVINKIDIYDISGRLMVSLPIQRQQQNIIRVDNFSNGIYFIRIYTDKGIVNKKIIIN